MKNKKHILLSIIILFIVTLNIFLTYNKKEVLEINNSDIENNAMAILVNGEAQDTIPAKGSANYRVTVNCTKGTASWDYDNWGIIINTIDKGNIKCNVEFNKKNYLRINYMDGLPFLDGPLMPNEIESIEFMTMNVVPSRVLGSWDVSENQDRSIMAWYYDSDSNGKYEVYIGGNGGVIANPDSSHLFDRMNDIKSINLSNLDTSEVTDMSNMFQDTGYNSTVFNLNLGESFDTSNVTSMAYMFSSTGYNSSVFTLNLGDKFDTSNVTDMSAMFYWTGYSSTDFTLDFGDKFDTSNVTSMAYMFDNAGYKSLVFKLDLGDKFDTSNVTNMSQMFSSTGQSSTVFTLSLGDKFDTSNVKTMAYMFVNVGANNANFILNLGNKFNTSKVTNMETMFGYTGYSNPNFTLDLRTFNFDRVSNYTSIFSYSKTSNTAYVKNAADKTWVSEKGFAGTIIDCSSNTCP